MSLSSPLRATTTALVVTIMVMCRTAWAESVFVLLAGPTGGTGVPTEVVNRVRGELIADGFEVEVSPPVVVPDRADTLRRAGRGAGAAIVVGVFVDETSGGIDLHLLDSLSDRVVTRHLEAPTKSPDQGPQVVARHAVSLLRANLLDFVLEGLQSALSTASKGPASPSKPSVQQTSHETDSSPQNDANGGASLRRLALEGGLGVLGGFEGVGASIMPVLRVRYSAAQAFQLRLTGAGLGSSPSVQAPSGSATVSQGLVQLDAMGLFGQGRWMRPVASVGVGAYFAGVAGSGVLPYEGRTDSTVAVALSGCVGAAFQVARDIETSLELQAIVTEPGVVLRFVDLAAARMGRPLLFATLTVAGWI